MPLRSGLGSNFIRTLLECSEEKTGCFPLQRGVRQWCTLSPHIFILAAETLALRVLHNDLIKGISINDKEVKILQYADDTIFFFFFFFYC